jgi:hypothetical protein
MNKRLPRMCLLAGLFLIPILACNMPDPTATGDGPTVTIVSPADGSIVVVGQQVLIQSSSIDARGISHVELIVDAVPTRADPPLEGTPTVFAIAQPWFPQAPGDAVIQVVAYSVTGRKSLPASITLHVVDEAAGGTATATAPAPTSVPDVTAESGCTLNASFDQDVTIPDESELQPGVSFVKTWRILNSGTCDWEAGFEFVFVSGEQMGAPASVSAPPTVAGATADISVPMTAPAAPGTYKGNWRMRSHEGQAFGSTVWALIVVPSPATGTPTFTDTPESMATVEPTDTPEPTEIPPEAPTNLVKSTLPSGYVSFAWVDNANDEEGFHILTDGAIYTSIGADAEGWGFFSGEHFCGETVHITLVAYKGDSWSDPTNEVQYIGPPCALPVVAQDSGVTMVLGNALDLDTGTVGPLNSAAEILWQNPGNLFLRAVNGMSFGTMGAVGPSVPSYGACEAMTKSSLGGVSVPTLQAGTRLCYDTTEGNLAGIRVDEIQADDDIVLSFVTWEGVP